MLATRPVIRMMPFDRFISVPRKQMNSLVRQTVPLVCVLAAIAFAAIVPAPAAASDGDLLRRAAGHYRIDSARTETRFTVVQFGFATVTGRFKRTKGIFRLNRKVASSKVDVTVDATSVTHLNKRVKKFLHGPDLLDVARYPSISFRSRSVRRTGDDSAEVRGDLTIRGVTQPITMTVRLAPGGQDDGGIAFNASGTFKRSRFGLTIGLGLVSDEVGFNIDVIGVRK